MNYWYEIPISEEAYKRWKDHFPLNPIGHECYGCKKILNSKDAWGYNGNNRGYYCRPCGLKAKEEYGKNGK